MNVDTNPLDSQICFLLYKASRTMTRLYKPVLDSLNITYPQYITMQVMWKEEIIDFKELGRILDLKTGTLTPIIKRLEVQGHVYREMNQEDNRRVFVKLTETGRELKNKAMKIPDFLLSYIKMDREQYTDFVKNLKGLGIILDQAEKKQKEDLPQK